MKPGKKAPFGSHRAEKLFFTIILQLSESLEMSPSRELSYGSTASIIYNLFHFFVYKTPKNWITHISRPIWGISLSLPGRFYIKSTLEGHPRDFSKGKPKVTSEARPEAKKPRGHRPQGFLAEGLCEKNHKGAFNPGVHKTWAWGMPCPCDSRPCMQF